MLRSNNFFINLIQSESKIPVLFGIATYLLVVGPAALYPTNIGWLGGGFDSTQHYLGWAFFRFSPWTFPLGLNPNFGLEISSSIVYSDSIPIFAIFFKIFNPLLSEPFQYFGVWMLLCFVLQSLFAWLLAGLITSDRWLKFLIMGLIACSPAMWHRLGFQCSLSSHFTILAALYLALRYRGQIKPWQWPLLIIVTGLIHAYLLIMVLCIWLSNYFARYMQSKVRLSYAMKIEAAIIFIGLPIGLWQAGYFSLGESGVVTESTYGIGKLNILTPFNADNWSYILPKLLVTDFSYESFNYYGLGILLLTPIAIFFFFRDKSALQKFIYQYKALIICCSCLALFAVTNNIGLGNWQIAIPIPEVVLNIASIFRASGRFFWPAYYLSIFILLQLICKNNSKLTSQIILCVCLLIQIADTSAGWRINRHHFMQPMSSSVNKSLGDPFWSVAAKKYKRVDRSVLPHNLIQQYYQDWDTWANYAAVNHLGTNSAYLARVNEKLLELMTLRLNAEISSGVYRTDTLYILENDKAVAALKRLNTNKDLLAKIDGVNVLAPEWNYCNHCQKIPSDNWILFSNLIPNVGEKLLPTPKGINKLFLNIGNGWSAPEPWGIWTDGRTADLIILTPRSKTKSFIITARAYLGKNHKSKIAKMTVNGRKFDLILLERNKITIPINAQDLENGFLHIHFEIESPLRPQEQGDGNDNRALGIGLEQAHFQ